MTRNVNYDFAYSQVEVIMQKIPCGPFAKPRSTGIDNNTNQNNCNSNHNILTQQNNLPTNGQSLYHHQYRHHHHQATNNSYNNYRPPPISVGGPCGTGIDQVDNSNASMDARPVMALTPNSLVDMQIPSETSETSSSSEPSSSSEEWESGECCDPIISSNVSNNFDETQAINNQLDVKCGVKFSNSRSCTVECDDHDRDMIHLDYLGRGENSEKKSEKQEKNLHKNHYSDDNYYMGSSVSLVAAAIPISCPTPPTDPDNQSQSLTSASPPTKILSQRKKFKAKSGGGPVTTSTGKKIRWLANMKSDPDFRETLNKNVHFRATGLSPIRTSNDSLNSDYYSSICDKQLSFGSPAKSPSDLIRLSKVHEHRRQECPDIVIASKKKPPVIPEFCIPPPNTPTTPGPTDQSSQDDSRKSPAKTETSFKQRFFNFTRRDHDTGAKEPLSDAEQVSTSIPIIKINDTDNALPLPTTTKASSNSKFSFRDLRHEIQSAIKMHHQQNHATASNNGGSNNDNHSNNKGNSDKKSKKIE